MCVTAGEADAVPGSDGGAGLDHCPVPPGCPTPLGVPLASRAVLGEGGPC